MNTNSPCHKKKQILKDLFVIDVKPALFSKDFQEYRDTNGLMYIGGCRRDVLIGKASTIPTPPLLEDNNVSIYSEGEAYTHILNYAAGLLSRTRGETQIVSQFKNAYAELATRNYLSSKSLQCVFESLMHDNGIIRNHITPTLKPAFFEACAHELSSQVRSDTTLVVVNADNYGRPDSVTQNILKYLTSRTKNAPDKIFFTHPDASMLESVYRFFLKQKVRGKISSDIEAIPFDIAFDAGARLQDMKKVYVCYTMGQDTAIDNIMAAEWQQKETIGGQLTHLGGNKKADRVSKGTWLSTDFFSYVSPEDISHHQEIRKQENNIAVNRGKFASHVCTAYREYDQRPTPKKIIQALDFINPN